MFKKFQILLLTSQPVFFRRTKTRRWFWTCSKQSATTGPSIKFGSTANEVRGGELCLAKLRVRKPERLLEYSLGQVKSLPRQTPPQVRMHVVCVYPEGVTESGFPCPFRAFLITMPIPWAAGPGWNPSPLQDESQGCYSSCPLHICVSKGLCNAVPSKSSW